MQQSQRQSLELAEVNCCRIYQRQLTTAGGNLVISMCQYEFFDVRKAIFIKKGPIVIEVEAQMLMAHSIDSSK